jgi:hypothetical protein
MYRVESIVCERRAIQTVEDQDPGCSQILHRVRGTAIQNIDESVVGDDTVAQSALEQKRIMHRPVRARVSNIEECRVRDADIARRYVLARDSYPSTVKCQTVHHYVVGRIVFRDCGEVPFPGVQNRAGITPVRAIGM